MKMIQATFDTTTFLLWADSKEDAAIQLQLLEPKKYVKLEPIGQWVYKWADDPILWSNITFEEVPLKRGIIFHVSH